MCSHEHLLELSSWEFDLKNIIESEQDTIESDHEQDTEQQKREKVLLKWKEQQGSGATYRKLINSLRNMGNNVVANRFQCLAITGMWSKKVYK